MRGAGMRLQLDVRRRWQCPRCGLERKLPAAVTSVRCACISDASFMKIVEGQRRARPIPKPLNLFLEFEPDAAEVNSATVAADPPRPAVEPSAVETPVPADASPPKTTERPASPSPPKQGDQPRKSRRQRGRDRRGNRNREGANKDTRSPETSVPVESADKGSPVSAPPSADIDHSAAADSPTSDTPPGVGRPPDAASNRE